MREIKFRGKRLDGGGWIEGSLIVDYNMPEGASCRIVPLNTTYDWYAVDPKSVGQYTGLKDKNGKDIYEGDIVVWGDNSPEEVFYTAHAEFAPIAQCTKPSNNFEIIGKIYENPEILNQPTP